eukprot:scaffold3181_cov389-Prasinococcus_capsulatus_cf.AAC.22
MPELHRVLAEEGVGPPKARVIPALHDPVPGVLQGGNLALRRCREPLRPGIVDRVDVPVDGVHGRIHIPAIYFNALRLHIVAAPAVVVVIEHPFTFDASFGTDEHCNVVAEADDGEGGVAGGRIGRSEVVIGWVVQAHC